jgi:hypothetical protein
MLETSRIPRLLASPAATLATSALFAGSVALYFVRVWHAGPLSLWYNVPIAAPFAAFFLDRLLPRPSGGRTAALVDVAVLTLALLRVFAPPLPWASGHALFVSYAALTARRWPARIIAGAVLLQVIYMKLFVTGGLVSLIAGLILGSVASVARRQLFARKVPDGCPPPV